MVIAAAIAVFLATHIWTVIFVYLLVSAYKSHWKKAKIRPAIRVVHSTSKIYSCASYKENEREQSSAFRKFLKQTTERGNHKSTPRRKMTTQIYEIRPMTPGVKFTAASLGEASTGTRDSSLRLGVESEAWPGQRRRTYEEEGEEEGDELIERPKAAIGERHRARPKAARTRTNQSGHEHFPTTSHQERDEKSTQIEEIWPLTPDEEEFSNASLCSDAYYDGELDVGMSEHELVDRPKAAVGERHRARPKAAGTRMNNSEHENISSTLHQEMEEVSELLTTDVEELSNTSLHLGDDTMHAHDGELEERPKAAVGERRRARPKAARTWMNDTEHSISTTSHQERDERRTEIDEILEEEFSDTSLSLGDAGGGDKLADRPKAAVGERHRARPKAARTRMNDTEHCISATSHQERDERSTEIDEILEEEFSDTSLSLGDAGGGDKLVDRPKAAVGERRRARPKAARTRMNDTEHEYISTTLHQEMDEVSELLTTDVEELSNASLGDDALHAHDGEDACEQELEERPKAAVGERHRARPKAAVTRLNDTEHSISTTSHQERDERRTEIDEILEEEFSDTSLSLGDAGGGDKLVDRPKAAVGERHRARPKTARTRMNDTEHCISATSYQERDERSTEIDEILEEEFSDTSLSLGDAGGGDKLVDRPKAAVGERRRARPKAARTRTNMSIHEYISNEFQQEKDERSTQIDLSHEEEVFSDTTLKLEDDGRSESEDELDDRPKAAVGERSRSRPKAAGIRTNHSGHEFNSTMAVTSHQERYTQIDEIRPLEIPDEEEAFSDRSLGSLGDSGGGVSKHELDDRPKAAVGERSRSRPKAARTRTNHSGHEFNSTTVVTFHQERDAKSTQIDEIRPFEPHDGDAFSDRSLRLGDYGGGESEHELVDRAKVAEGKKHRSRPKAATTRTNDSTKFKQERDERSTQIDEITPEAFSDRSLGLGDSGGCVSEDELDDRPKAAVGERSRSRPKAARTRTNHSGHEFNSTTVVTSHQERDERSTQIDEITPDEEEEAFSDRSLGLGDSGVCASELDDRPKAAVGERSRSRPKAATTRTNHSGHEFNSTTAVTSHQERDERSTQIDEIKPFVTPDEEAFSDTSREHELVDRPKAAVRKRHRSRSKAATTRTNDSGHKYNISNKFRDERSTTPDEEEHELVGRPKAAGERSRSRPKATRTRKNHSGHEFNSTTSHQERDERRTEKEPFVTHNEEAFSNTSLRLGDDGGDESEHELVDRPNAAVGKKHRSRPKAARTRTNHSGQKHISTTSCRIRGERNTPIDKIRPLTPGFSSASLGLGDDSDDTGPLSGHHGNVHGGKAEDKREQELMERPKAAVGKRQKARARPRTLSGRRRNHVRYIPLDSMSV